MGMTVQPSGGGNLLSVLTAIIPLLILALAFSLPCIPAKIAKKKGYGFAGFYIFGLFLFLIALIVALCLSDKNQQIESIKEVIAASQSPKNPENIE